MTTGLIQFNHTDLPDGRIGWPARGSVNWHPNYGDMLVCAAILRALPEGERSAVWGKPKVPLTRAIMRGSTYLHGQWDFDRANAQLDALDVPVAVVGLGAQSAGQDPRFLDGNAGARDFIARLNEKGASISVRGAFTAAVVERLGGRSIRVTGCPSAFYMGPAPRVRLNPRLGTPAQVIGVSLHTGLGRSIFCDDPVPVRARHVEALALACRGALRGRLFEQGVTTEQIAADRNLPNPERRRAAEEMLARLGAKDEVTAREVMQRIVTPTSVEDWIERAGRVMAMIGFRFHGNMVGLLQGKPCFFWTYDSRITEFCELYALPSRPAAAGPCDPVAIMRDHDWGRTHAALDKAKAELDAFWTENGFT